MVDWFEEIVAGTALPSSVATELLTRGFAIVSGFIPPQRVAALSHAYDVAVAEAAGDDLRVGSTTTRVQGLIGRGAEFDALYIHPMLLEACACVIRRPFKLSSLLARTVHPETTAQPLHIDVKRGGEAWPLVGSIVMGGSFREANGATRLVPESHHWSMAPGDVMDDLTGDHKAQ